MSTPTKAELKDRTYRIARLLLSDLPLGQEVQTRDADWGQKLGVDRPTFGRHRALFEHLGILKMENKWGHGDAPRSIWFTRLTDEAETYRLLDAHFARGGSWRYRGDRPDWRNPDRLVSERPKAKVVKPTRMVVAGGPSEDETVAIAGPDPVSVMERLAPARKDEGLALIEAARQYQNRNQAVIDSFKALEDLGIAVDREKAMKAVKLPRDERLEAVSDVLDYIAQLERENARLTRYSDDRRLLLSQIAELRGENERLKAANRRMSETKAQQTVAAQ